MWSAGDLVSSSVVDSGTLNWSKTGARPVTPFKWGHRLLQPNGSGTPNGRCNRWRPRVVANPIPVGVFVPSGHPGGGDSGVCEPATVRHTAGIDPTGPLAKSQIPVVPPGVERGRRMPFVRVIGVRACRWMLPRVGPVRRCEAPTEHPRQPGRRPGEVHPEWWTGVYEGSGSRSE
jgi:hypothetical protein